jgi:hypothetical protein
LKEHIKAEGPMDVILPSYNMQTSSVLQILHQKDNGRPGANNSEEKESNKQLEEDRVEH